ncbi:hypothetical protein CBS147333_1338 [Penicillium roqueforti]|nr:hypothetical protein CBS147333_1338 [Penicillium roqueforti]KAI3190964.1 hypothetical protein CBS147311_9654 [Penicillium roqueforti]KAI3262343.1 hypothetical protein CBS147308_9264 [Penicillium roqueforti]KAI3280701.1 hypothetical protein DTO003C3_9393 [Penicillium roqueforti]
MDTAMAKLPSEVGTILRENIAVIEIVSTFSIGAYNALETVFITFDTVKNYRSLYFWSIQVASWGILMHALPAMACFLSRAPELPMSIPFVIGWYAMVTGQSIVLYSRLYLVVLDVSKDLVICGLYIYEAIRALKCIIQIRGRNGRKVIIHLLWVNILVVALNILLLLTEYKLHYIQVSFKTVVYCIKLKLEFSVLNRLRSLVHSPALASPPDPMQQCRSSIDMNLFQAYFSRPIVALDMATPSSTGPVGVIRCDSPSSSIPDYHGMLREISDGGD